ncbi:MAG: polynucleotide kinase-phosphatase [Ktedonobacteraceae bacterium]|nr:polynucleotide kinase-phosphatase [Ktedonobacteraceae bacterium]
MKITIPEFALVVLIGASGSGKSTFAHKHFKPTETISSDFCRGLVSDDENDQSATRDAFQVLHFIAARRLERGKLTVIDATNVQPEARRELISLARQYHCQTVAIVFKLPEKLCHERNRQRPDRNFGSHVVRNQTVQLRSSLHNLKKEGFHTIALLESPEQVESVEIERQRLKCDLRREHGPFDIIGDVHGCFDELCELLQLLDYQVTGTHEHGSTGYQVSHPQGRRVIFLGDLVDRGPNSPEVLRLVMDMTASGMALCIPGNHDMKLLRKLNGRNITMTHGIVETLQQLQKEPLEFIERVKTFLDGLISHYVLDEGRLVVAHAGLKEHMQGRVSRAVRDFTLYGETTGESDEFGLPIRHNWAADYCGSAMVVYGHTPVPRTEWLNKTINIDTGCVFGGKLTALRYPERELVEVPATMVYCEPARPLHIEQSQTSALTAQQQHDDVLDIEDVTGKRIITTRLQHQIIIREENAAAALEVMSRFAANPRWLIYLPPTMSPSETSSLPGLLEHPAEAFAYYRKAGIQRVICEEKHMGSRAVIIVCRDEEAVRKRFGVTGERSGICYTRAGRHFFEDQALETALLARVRAALDVYDFWAKFQTDWVCLDCELMPWSLKAQSLLLQQYAAVGTAARAALTDAVSLLEQGKERELPVDALLNTYRQRQSLAERYVEAYRRYCWPVSSVTDLRLAPFHLLATEGQTYFERDHLWHMHTLAGICQAGRPLLLATPYLVIDVNDSASIEEGIRWWEQLTEHGGEGMVVKPLDVLAQGKRGAVQPALKCRGPEYLRIIYGPDYTMPEHLQNLRARGLSMKRSLALREFTLGREALERFVSGEPLRRVHECVFGVLALESEPVDPRL